ncbi:hypothetical protein P8C59_004913 [Phyllachora maydis]|uniref:Uncharacterized protein n=1 Tax=Phyllachora maydis TaxID=1825666 RepID=A0AAD9I3V5_9PEZI|nr:hypothetical protein P8C59_004913 [Phyllachora maydis]
MNSLSALFLNFLSTVHASFDASLANASPVNAPTVHLTCNQDNCLRQVFATRFSARPSSADCSSYLAVTVTAAPVTVTAVVTATGPAPPVLTTEIGTATNVFVTQIVRTITPAAHARRDAAATVPAYASACSCIGVHPFTVTAPGPTLTVTETMRTLSATPPAFATPNAPEKVTGAFHPHDVATTASVTGDHAAMSTGVLAAAIMVVAAVQTTGNGEPAVFGSVAKAPFANVTTADAVSSPLPMGTGFLSAAAAVLSSSSVEVNFPNAAAHVRLLNATSTLLTSTTAPADIHVVVTAVSSPSSTIGFHNTTSSNPASIRILSPATTSSPAPAPAPTDSTCTSFYLAMTGANATTFFAAATATSSDAAVLALSRDITARALLSADAATADLLLHSSGSGSGSSSSTALLVGNTDRSAAWSSVYFDTQASIAQQGHDALRCGVVATRSVACFGAGAAGEDAWVFQVCGSAVGGRGPLVVGREVEEGCAKVEFKAVCA